MIGKIISIAALAIAAVTACPYSSSSFALNEIDYYPSIPYASNYIDDYSYYPSLGGSILPASSFSAYEPVYTFSSVPAPLSGPISLPGLPFPTFGILDTIPTVASPAYFPAPLSNPISLPALPSLPILPGPFNFPAPLPAGVCFPSAL